MFGLSKDIQAIYSAEEFSASRFESLRGSFSPSIPSKTCWRCTVRTLESQLGYSGWNLWNGWNGYFQYLSMRPLGMVAEKAPFYNSYYEKCIEKKQMVLVSSNIKFGSCRNWKRQVMNSIYSGALKGLPVSNPEMKNKNKNMSDIVSDTDILCLEWWPSWHSRRRHMNTKLQMKHCNKGQRSHGILCESRDVENQIPVIPVIPGFVSRWRLSSSGWRCRDSWPIDLVLVYRVYSNCSLTMT